MMNFDWRKNPKYRRSNRYLSLREKREIRNRQKKVELEWLASLMNNSQMYKKEEE